MTNGGRLPGDWVRTTIGEICIDLQYGYTASASNEPCGPRFLRITDIQNGQVDWSSVPYCIIDQIDAQKYSLHTGDIVFARTGGTVGKSYIIGPIPEPTVFASYLIRISAHQLIYPEFLYYFFQSALYWEQIGLKKGGLKGNINATTLSSLSLEICSLSQQHRIVSKIEELFSELDKGIESLKTAREQLKVYRQAVLKHAFEGKLTARWREENKERLEPSTQVLDRIRDEKEARYQEQMEHWKDALDSWERAGAEVKKPVKPRRQKDPNSVSAEELSELQDLPEGWLWVKLGELVWSVKDGPHYSPEYVKNGIPFISGGNVRPNGVDFASAKFISSELHQELSSRCKPEKGDVLYTKGGTTGIARVNTYDIEFNVWVHIAVLKITRSLNPFYLQHALNSPRCYSQSQKLTHGVGNQDLGLTRMVNIILPLCPPVEQEQIVQIFERLNSEFDEIERTIEIELARSETLRQSILKKAFSGQLVPQDPNDEPASVLLERIRAEKAAQAETSKPKAKRQPRRKRTEPA